MFTINIAIKDKSGSTKVQPVATWSHVLAMFSKLLKLGIRPMAGDIITDSEGTTYIVYTLMFNQSTDVITVILE